MPDPEWDNLRDRTYSPKILRLGALIDRGVTEFSYTYDFGDDWRHTITIEATAAADHATDYPRYLDGARRAPPEDVGGIPGFELFLEAIADPNHEEHDELMRWYGAPFDPALIDEDAIRTRIAKLARRRAIGKAGVAKSRGQIN
ncbi:plasmid pRiA4b ORF-3 family protein [Ancylobacter polymorphus]|uniref:Plasmid pRiA4b ORF-3 family protein n=1 Tax=Ancylobacter polymorphus TaxID=223390 RepID=A0A9E6ZYD6_9HYPH|nr:plasmid pRiA4b ORF-3 family protein [Ancylobacter polymorphus]UOK73889.1 plasmid pRiA4b ORF-3 family protein [Ancylobacter polymorphus]